MKETLRTVSSNVNALPIVFFILRKFLVDLKLVYKERVKDWKSNLMQNNMGKQFIIIAMAKAGILSTPLSYRYLTPVQIQDMIPCCLEYNIGCS